MPESQDSEKLLNLYWNRAELKKALAEVRDEQYSLRKEIKERDGSIARLEQQLGHIEDMLLDPEWVFSIAVHYQLRALNEGCKRRLAKFAEQLKQQREKRQHKSLLDAWNSKRSGRASKVKAAFDQLQGKRQECDAALAYVEGQYRSRPLLLRWLYRRRFKSQVHVLDETRNTIDLKEADLREELEQLKQSSPPEQPGLDIAAKRSINFMILAFAQQLFIGFDDDNLATLVRDSGVRGAGSIRYGNRQECERLLDEIQERLGASEDVADYADILQKRAKILSDKALFMKDDDAIPSPESVSVLICINDSGGVSQRNANLLGDDYWSLKTALSR